MNNLTNRVDEKLQFKTERQDNNYMAEFEKNVLKRQKMEVRKKTQAEQVAEYKEVMDEKKWEKSVRV